MQWKDFVPIIEKEETYRCICSNLSGSLPSSLFKDLVESQEYKLEKDKELVFQAIQVSKIIIDNNIKYETYKSILIHGLENEITNKKSPYFKKINVNFNKTFLKISEINTRLCYDELINTFAKKKLIEVERSKILLQKFTLMVTELTHQKKMDIDLGYKKALKHLYKSSNFLKISYKPEKIKIFETIKQELTKKKNRIF